MQSLKQWLEHGKQLNVRLSLLVVFILWYALKNVHSLHHCHTSLIFYLLLCSGRNLQETILYIQVCIFPHLLTVLNSRHFVENPAVTFCLCLYYQERSNLLKTVLEWQICQKKKKKHMKMVLNKDQRAFWNAV